MKRATVLMALIVFAVLLSSVLTLPAAADRDKRAPDKSAAKGAPKRAAKRSEKRASEVASLFVAQNPASSKRDKDEHAAKITGKVRNQNDEAVEGDDEEQDPDLPPGMHDDKEAFFRARDEFIALLHGLEPGKPFDPMARGRAL